MARGAEGDCPEQHTKNKKRKRARAFKLWFFSLFLCCVKAPVENTVEVHAMPQKIHGVPNTSTTTPDNPQKALTRQEIKRRVKVGKARWEEQRRKKKRAWYARLLPKLKMPKLFPSIPKPTKYSTKPTIPKVTKFVKKTVKPPKMKNIQDVSTMTRPHIDDYATKEDPSPKETTPPTQDERPKEPTAARNETEACPGTVVARVNKDPKRLIDHSDLEKTLKALEALADLATRTELPQMPESSKRIVTFEEATQGCSKEIARKQTKKDLESHPETTQGCSKVVARRNQTKKDLESHPEATQGCSKVVARRKTKKDLESHPALPRAWRDQMRRAAKRNMEPRCLAFRKRSFDFKKHLCRLLAVMLLIFSWYCVSTLSSTGKTGHSSNSTN